MRVADFDPCIVESWAAYELFRDLNFDSDDITFVYTNDDRHISVVLFDGKPNEFVYSAGHTKLNSAEFDAQWAQFTDGLANGDLDDTELGAAFSRSFASSNAAELLRALEAKGIHYELPPTTPIGDCGPN